MLDHRAACCTCPGRQLERYARCVPTSCLPVPLTLSAFVLLVGGDWEQEGDANALRGTDAVYDEAAPYEDDAATLRGSQTQEAEPSAYIEQQQAVEATEEAQAADAGMN